MTNSLLSRETIDVSHFPRTYLFSSTSLHFIPLHFNPPTISHTRLNARDSITFASRHSSQLGRAAIANALSPFIILLLSLLHHASRVPFARKEAIMDAPFRHRAIAFATWER